MLWLICDWFKLPLQCMGGARGSVVRGVRPVNKRSHIQIPLWSHDVMCCANYSQGILSLHFLSPPSWNWVPICNGLVTHSGGVNDSHPLSTTEAGDKHRLNAPSCHGEWFDLTTAAHGLRSDLGERRNYIWQSLKTGTLHRGWLWPVTIILCSKSLHIFYPKTLCGWSMTQIGPREKKLYALY